MPVMQLRTADDAYPLSRMDFGAKDTGTTSTQIGFKIWNDRPVTVTGELLGTGDGTRTSFPTAFKPIVNHANCAIAVKVDGVAATGYTIDHENGNISFGTPPASGVVVTCDYAYSVGSVDAATVVLIVEQTAGFVGDGSDHTFSLPTACIQAVKLLVAGIEIPSSGFSLQDSGMTLYISEAPAVGAAIQFYYVDAVCQGGYYEVRSSGVQNPYSQSGMADDAESAFFKLGGLFTLTSRLLGTGDGTIKVFSTGTPILRTVTQVTVGGVETTDYSVNNVTGVITLGTAPANAAEVRATYTYERGHKIGNIKQWTGRTAYLRVALPYDAPNSVLSTRVRVVSQ